MVSEKLYQDRGLLVSEVAVEGEDIWEKIFNTVLVGDFAAYFLAEKYGAEPGQVPMVEEFKEMIV